MQLEPWKQELIEALRMLQQRKFGKIDLGRMLDRAERCFEEGEMLYCLVFLKIARLAHRSALQANGLVLELPAESVGPQQIVLQDSPGCGMVAQSSGTTVRMKAAMTLPSGLVLPLDRIEEICRCYRVKELSVFGSQARGDTSADSDIDLLVEFQKDAPVGLIEFAALTRELSETLGCEVDLVSKNGLKPLIRDAVLREARLVHAA